MDGFVAAVVSRAAVADGNAPVVAATAAAVRAASPRKFTSLSLSLPSLISRSAEEAKAKQASSAIFSRSIDQGL